MKTLLTLLFVLATLQQGQSPEEMYSSFDRDGHYQAMQEQMDEITRQSESAEQERNEKKTFVLVISLLLGIIPVAVVGKKIYKDRSWESNPSGMWKALAIAILGGIVLFAFNYGIFYLRLIHNETFRILLPAAIGIAAIAIFVVGMRKN